MVWAYFPSWEWPLHTTLMIDLTFWLSCWSGCASIGCALPLMHFISTHVTCALYLHDVSRNSWLTYQALGFMTLSPLLTFTWYLAKFTPACELVTLTLNFIRLFTSHYCALTLFCGIFRCHYLTWRWFLLERTEGTIPSLPRLHLVWWLALLEIFSRTMLIQSCCMSVTFWFHILRLHILCFCFVRFCPLKSSAKWHWRVQTPFTISMSNAMIHQSGLRTTFLME